MSKNKKNLYIFLCICFLSIFLTGIYYSEKNDITTAFVLTEYEGKIAVFIKGGDTPQQIIDTEFQSLPKNDQEKLKNGIEVNSVEELYSLIEDFSG